MCFSMLCRKGPKIRKITSHLIKHDMKNRQPTNTPLLHANGFTVDDKHLNNFYSIFVKTWFFSSKRCHCHFTECFYSFEKDWLDELILIYITITNESEFYGAKMSNRSSEEIINK